MPHAACSCTTLQDMVEGYFRAAATLPTEAWIGVSRGTPNQQYKFIDGSGVAQVKLWRMCGA